MIEHSNKALMRALSPIRGLTETEIETYLLSRVDVVSDGLVLRLVGTDAAGKHIFKIERADQ